MQSRKLSAFCETQVIAALRNCSGALSDLSEGEVSGPFGLGKQLAPGQEVPDDGSWPLKGGDKKSEKEAEEETKPIAKEDDQKEPASSSKEAAEKGKKEKASKEPKRKAKRKERNREQGKKTSNAGERGPPERTVPRKKECDWKRKGEDAKRRVERS